MDIETNEQSLLKEVISGKYRDCYLIYNRKSTDEPNSQKNSIKYQKSENTAFAYRTKLSIAQLSLKGFSRDGVISEKHSGFKEKSELIFGKDNTVQYRIERPKFYRLVQYLNKGYFKGVIVLCWDRASRNKGDNNVIEKLMKMGVDFQFTLASYDKTSSGALHMDIDGMVAQHHSRVTSEKVTLTIKQLRDKGICPYKAPVGYLNLGSMEQKPFDPVRAPIIKQLFERYATGLWSLADMANWAVAQGLTMQPAKRRRTEDEILAEEEDDDLFVIEKISRPVDFNHIHKMLRNRFYTGRIRGNEGKYVQSISHTALVSDELFDTVQRMLNKKKVSVYYPKKINSPYRGLIRCGICNRVYTPYVQKGITYYGARCKKECTNGKKTINRAFIENEIKTIMHHLVLTNDELFDLFARTKTDIALFEIKRNSELQQIDREKRKLREDLTYLRNNKLILLRSEMFTPESYLEEEANLNARIADLQNREQMSDLSIAEVIKEVVKLSELLKTLCLWYEKGNSFEKEEIIKKVFSELTISQNTLKYKCASGLQALGARFMVVGDPTTWISELIQSEILIEQTTRDFLKIIENYG